MGPGLDSHGAHGGPRVTGPGVRPTVGAAPGASRGQPADRPLSPGLIDTCRECGARALELMGQLQEQGTVHQAQPGLVRVPLQGVLQLGQVRAAAVALSMGWGPEG